MATRPCLLSPPGVLHLHVPPAAALKAYSPSSGVDEFPPSSRSRCLTKNWFLLHSEIVESPPSSRSRCHGRGASPGAATCTRTASSASAAVPPTALNRVSSPPIHSSGCEETLFTPTALNRVSSPPPTASARPVRTSPLRRAVPVHSGRCEETLLTARGTSPLRRAVPSRLSSQLRCSRRPSCGGESGGGGGGSSKLMRTSAWRSQSNPVRVTRPSSRISCSHGGRCEETLFTARDAVHS